MRIVLNGETRETGYAETLAQLLDAFGVDPGRAAVAVNSTVVPGSKLSAVSLTEGDRVEIIEAVGGG